MGTWDKDKETAEAVTTDPTYAYIDGFSDGYYKAVERLGYLRTVFARAIVQAANESESFCPFCKSKGPCEEGCIVPFAIDYIPINEENNG